MRRAPTRCARLARAASRTDSSPRPAAPGLRKAFSRTLSDGAIDSSARSRAIRPMPAAQRRRGARRGRAPRRRAVTAPSMRHGAEQRAADLLLAGAAQADEAEQLALRGSRSRPGRRRASRGRAPTTRTGPARSSALWNSSSVERPTIRLTSSSGVVSRDRLLADHAARRASPRRGRRCGRSRRADARRRSCRRRAPCRRRIASNSRSTSSAGRLAVGSSSTRKSQSTTSARAMATSDFSVRLRLRTRVVGIDVAADQRERLAARALGARASRSARSGRGQPRRGKPCGEADVLGDRHPFDQAEILMDEGDRLALAARRRGGDRARRRSRPRRCRRRTMPPRILIRVDLPAPFSPSSATISPRRDVEAHALERPRAAEGLGDVVETQDAGLRQVVPPSFANRSGSPFRWSSCAEMRVGA